LIIFVKFDNQVLFGEEFGGEVVLMELRTNDIPQSRRTGEGSGHHA